MIEFHKEFYALLSRYGELEQMRGGRWDQNGQPIWHLPVFVWRFCSKDKYLDGFLVDAAKTFVGRVPWQMEPGKDRRGRNSVLAPRRLFELETERSQKPNLGLAPAETILETSDPAFVELAIADQPDLLFHVERVLEAGVR